MSLFHSPQTCGASASSLTCCESLDADSDIYILYVDTDSSVDTDLCFLSVQTQWLVSVSGGRWQRDTEQHSGLSVELWGGRVFRHFWRSQRLHHPSAGEEQELEDERCRVAQTSLAVRPESALSTKSEGKNQNQKFGLFKSTMQHMTAANQSCCSCSVGWTSKVLIK